MSAFLDLIVQVAHTLKSSYNQTDSTTARSLSAPGNGSFITGSVSGPLIKETCSMTASNGTLWAYTNQTGELCTK